MTLSQWSNVWLRSYVIGKKKKHTQIIYSTMIREHVLPILGPKEISEISKDDVLALVDALNFKEKLAASTIRLVLVVLNQLMDKALDSALISQNPCQGVRKPTLTSPDVEVFTRSEEALLIDEVFKDKDKRKFGFLISLYTGIRLGELLALKWSDIDFTEGMMHINKTVYSIKDDTGKYVLFFDTPKTIASRRTIPFSNNVREVLLQLKEENSEFVVSFHGNSVSPRTYQTLFRSFLKKKGLPLRKFHTLRHTFATRALEVGVDIKTLSELLGHESPEVTLRTYSHSLMDTKIKAMQMLSNIIL